MSQEESTLIDIEKQNMEDKHNDIEMKRIRSRRSSGRVKMFSPTNADNLTDKLRLNRNQLRNKKRQKQLVIDDINEADIEDEEGLKERSKLKSRKSKGKRFVP